MFSDPKTMQLYERIRREAMDFANIGWWSFRFNGTIIQMDRTSLRIMELQERFPEPGRVIGHRIENLVHYNSVGKLRNELRKHGQVRGLEWEFITPKGNERCVVQDSYLIRDPATGEEAIQVVMYDITERKRMEDLLAAHSQLLEQTNADLERRTRDLSQYVQSAMPQVTGAIETVRQAAAASDNQIVAGLQRAADTLHRQWRIFSALAARNAAGLTREPVLLADCIAQARAAMNGEFGGSHAQLDDEARLPEVMGDAALLAFVVEDLTRYACCLPAQGPVRLRFGFEPAPPKTYILFTVENVEAAPPAAVRWAEHTDHANVPELAAARGIIALHGGRLEAEILPGGALRYRFALPQA